MGFMGAGRDRRICTGRKRAAWLALTGAAAAAIAGLTGTGAAGASTVARSAVSGTEHFQVISTSLKSTTVPVVEWGAVGTADGVNHPDTANGTGRFVFPGGSYTVTHSPGPEPRNLNPKTCFLQTTGHGTFRLSDGTGKYKGITGSGKFTGSITAIWPKTKSGACDVNAYPVAFQQVIDGTGTASIP